MIALQKKSKDVRIKNKEKPSRTIRATKKKIEILKNELKQYLDSNGYLSYSTKMKKYLILGTNSPKNALTQCPQCSIGQLMIIRSPVTKRGLLVVQTIVMVVLHLLLFHKRLGFVVQRKCVRSVVGL